MSFKAPQFRKAKLPQILVGIAVLLAWLFGNPDTSKLTKEPRMSKISKGAAANFDYYSLVLSWSPSHCLRKDRSPARLQCDSGKPYSFVLHGLWPQRTKGWPQFCDSSPRRLGKDLIDDMLDIMPAKGLVKHQYKKHGTCSGLSAEQYFELSRLLFDKVNIPEKYSNSGQYFVTNARAIRDKFIHSNPGLDPDMIAVDCSGGNENRLKEVKICFDKQGDFRKCGKNEKVSRLCKGRKVVIPPARGSGL